VSNEDNVFFNADAMDTVRRVFVDSYNHVTAGVMSGGSREKILALIMNIVLREKPYLMCTPEGIKHIMDLIWTDEEHRNFILNLSFTFFARWGGTPANVQGLAICLAAGVSQIPDWVVEELAKNRERADTGTVAIPNELLMRMSSHEDAAGILENNKWLMTVLMINLFVEFDLEAINNKRKATPPTTQQ
jgi:hypothetical protein